MYCWATCKDVKDVNGPNNIWWRHVILGKTSRGRQKPLSPMFYGSIPNWGPAHLRTEFPQGICSWQLTIPPYVHHISNVIRSLAWNRRDSSETLYSQQIRSGIGEYEVGKRKRSSLLTCSKMQLPMLQDRWGKKWFIGTPTQLFYNSRHNCNIYTVKSNPSATYLQFALLHKDDERNQNLTETFRSLGQGILTMMLIIMQLFTTRCQNDPNGLDFK